ncbi:zinc finger protein GLIS2 [Trichomycterus rosablanca]|uniref:zinc finger protein GLIS2 n=1 Tax=Trichomycterus rosablanca TaxID=2290929 RepID=UPI002F355D3C
MLSLDEPLDLKISSSCDRASRTSICAPLQIARTRVLRPICSSDTDSDRVDSPTSTPDLSVCSSSPSSPQNSSSSCSPPPLDRDSEIITYQHGGASSPPSLPPGFQMYLPYSRGLHPSRSRPAARPWEGLDPSEPVEEQLMCRWFRCHLLFERLQDLVDHVTECHVKVERSSGYRCRWEECTRKGRGFNARYKMMIHIRTHTNEKPHQCSTCSKSFSRLENLKIHTRSHTGEKPYVCPYEGCGKRYSNSSDRFKHTRTHYEDRPYCCKMTGCPKRYTDPSSLRKHIKAHGHQAVSPGPERHMAGAEPSSPLSTPLLPGAALALLHTHAAAASPLDLSMHVRPAGGHGRGRTTLLHPVLLPTLRHRAVKDGDDNEEGGEINARFTAPSWVFLSHWA